jgi:DNA-binding winged helix-turn-helix (wHTH) protein/HPt (histidine-containing phosphotransfer) domain-containing protein
MLTIKDSNDDVIAGLDAGADDYVAKSCEPSQLLARVRALLRRSGTAPSSPRLSWGLLCLDPASARVTYNQEEFFLRPKEYSLLELFLRHPQHILSRSTIIDHLWSMEETPVEGSVTSLIKDLRQRLKSAGMEADLIETVYGMGYRLRVAPIEDGRSGGLEDANRVAGSQPRISETRWINHRANDWDAREQRGMAVIEQITERFRGSLEQRIAVLEAVERSLEAGDFSLQQRKAAGKEAHNLAGGLGTFGYAKASQVAQDLEHLLESELGKMSLANQFSLLLEKLKQELAKPLTQVTTSKG